MPLTGGGLSDTIVRAEVYDHSLSVEGVVVGGQRDLDPNFTLFRTDEELIVRHEYDCHACCRWRGKMSRVAGIAIATAAK